MVKRKECRCPGIRCGQREGANDDHPPGALHTEQVQDDPSQSSNTSLLSSLTTSLIHRRPDALTCILSFTQVFSSHLPRTHSPCISQCGLGYAPVTSIPKYPHHVAVEVSLTCTLSCSFTSKHSHIPSLTQTHSLCISQRGLGYAAGTSSPKPHHSIALRACLFSVHTLPPSWLG